MKYKKYIRTIRSIEKHWIDIFYFVIIETAKIWGTNEISILNLSEYYKINEPSHIINRIYKGYIQNFESTLKISDKNVLFHDYNVFNVESLQNHFSKTIEN